jgi:hypothetical protein
VDSVPDSLLLRKSDSVGNRTQTSGTVARNSDADNFIVAFRLLSLGSDGQVLECEKCFQGLRGIFTF